MKLPLVARAAFVGVLMWPFALGGQQIRPPKTWDEAALADWATPIAALGVRPTHLSEVDYYALRVENLRTYPVYYPGREPDGYWEMLQRVGPKPLIEPELLKNAADWIEAGRRVFDEADHLHLRTLDPKFIAAARSRETYEKFGAQPLPDGTVFGSRWVPTGNGVALSFGNCNNCHLAYLQDGTRVPGAPSFASTSRSKDAEYRNPLVNAVQFANRYVTGAAPVQMPAGASLGMWLYGSYGVPWGDAGVNQRLASMTKADYDLLVRANVLTGAVPRWNGSLFYPAKIPDLIGIKDRKYIDHTATHLHRGAGDVMRYAALVSYAETADFGAYHMLENGARRVQARLIDEALYALAMYLYSLDPPKNPNMLDEPAKAGGRSFSAKAARGAIPRRCTRITSSRWRAGSCRSSRLRRSTSFRYPWAPIQGWRCRPAREPVIIKPPRSKVSGTEGTICTKARRRVSKSCSIPGALPRITSRTVGFRPEKKHGPFRATSSG